jgi:NAD(P)-dependent dehydrogenase (short-subunit alcohol dehydrogenase family)
VGAELGVPGGVENLMAVLEAGLVRHGGAVELDILVNAAAVVVPPSIEQITVEDFDRQFAVNVKAPYFLIQSVLRIMRDRGRIISLSPEATHVFTSGTLKALTTSVAGSAGARGITVNTVAFLPADPRADAGRSADRAVGHSDVAAVVAFLASPAGGAVTGQCLDATGGVFLGPGLRQR